MPRVAHKASKRVNPGGEERHSMPVEWITGTMYKYNAKPVTEAAGEGPCEEP